MDRVNDGSTQRKSIQERIDEIMDKHRMVLKSVKNDDIDTHLSKNGIGSHTSNGVIDQTYHEKSIAIKQTPKTPLVLDKEIELDFSKTSMSKTDTKGIIEYANEDFMGVCGFKEEELMGQPHSIVRHPDMPRLVFRFMWNRLQQGEGLYAIVKNLSKTGEFYWVIAQLTVKFDGEGNIISYFARRKAAPRNAVYKIEKIYKILRNIEKEQSLEVAQKYFYGMLEEKNITYDDLILKTIGINEETLASYFVKGEKIENSDSLLKRWFG